MAKMMTNKDFFLAVLNANLSEEMNEKARHLMEVTEKKSAKRSTEKTALATANLALAREVAKTMVVGVPVAVSELSPCFPELSTSKLTAVMRVGVENGLFSKVENYKVGGKGRAKVGYVLNEVTEEEATEEATEEEVTEE